MANLKEIKKKLERGDHTEIAKRVGCHPKYVGMVLREQRNNNIIIQEAENLIKEREQLRIKALHRIQEIQSAS